MVKRSRKAQNEDEEMPVLTKEEKQVANYLRLNFKNRQGNLRSMKVDYFTGNKIVDFLMESKFGPGSLQDISKDAPYEEGKMPLLDSRQACVKYMQRLMSKQIFFRATKIYKETSVVEADGTPSNLRKRKVKETKEDENKISDSTSVKSSSPQTEKKEPKKKFKLELHEDQKFVDANEPYVWNHDPISTKNFIFGFLLIIGAILICCFPLWPPIIRQGVYYLSLGGCGFLGGIIALVIIKYILYTLIYILTVGKVKLWIFPNITEDVGFFESFVPVYTIETSTPELKSDVKDKIVEETTEPIESNTENIVSEKKINKASKSMHQMNDLTESTVEVTNVEAGEFVENMEKVQEDYDFEIVDGEENKIEDN